MHRQLLAMASAAACAMVCAWGGVAAAQTMSTNSASFNAGYGRISGQENRAVEVATRDANGNRLVVNGVIMSGQSSFSGGAASSASGAAVGGATAIGNNLTVVTQGDHNTVIVDSRQTNSGSVSATTTVATTTTSSSGGN
jgi:holdfast attachment protein HfaA